MDRSSVNSSNVLSVGYDSENMILEVEFLKGAIYQYYNVPEYIYSDLLSSESIGGFLHSHVKGVFSYSQV
ncbi:KTSC domain-containing protein [Marinobacter shengliensis]|uniref:KTSC domain-containing protein n=1 Tax=Marinobacter shengliensis TaxID=1389223 RepID=UPI000D10F1F1|nr:KTSC domain-containing protein [Marinobacter shengliensis]PSF12621.1 KTSC domain-containing protein [Marinobacter shengliensis]